MMCLHNRIPLAFDIFRCYQSGAMTFCTIETIGKCRTMQTEQKQAEAKCTLHCNFVICPKGKNHS